MLRKKPNGRLERQQPDGTWAEVPEAEQPEAVRKSVAVDWSQLSDLFADTEVESETGDAGPVRDTPALGAGAAVGGDVGVPGAGVGAGAGALVAAPEKAGRARRKAAGPRGAGDFTAARLEAPGVQGAEAPDLSTGHVRRAGSEDVGGSALDAALDIEVPGLTSGKSSSVLERLRRRRGLSTGVARPAQHVEVSERNARPRGPAVKDSTERRIVRKALQKSGPSRQVTSKPAPGSLNESPRWMQELFETHFRSSRSLELRKTMNRMKLSRQDYAIGWMVAIEAARRDPSILHLREVKE